MTTTLRFAEIAALAGDPARAGMLHALMDGRALTASELARVAGVAPQTASSHLGRMIDAGLLAVQKQGRHRYHRLATPAVAQVIESIMALASELRPNGKPVAVGPKDAALRRGRTCYDHFAGAFGVSLADALTGRGFVELTAEAGIVTDSGIEFLGGLGIDTAPMLARRTARTGRILCRPCLDWSERRPHLAGLVGASLCSHSFAMGWVKRVPGGRAVQVTPKGETVFRAQLGMGLR